MSRTRSILAAAFLALASQASGATYYVSPSGSDGAAGTLNAPWQTLNHALVCGDTVIIKTGSAFPNGLFAQTQPTGTCGWNVPGGYVTVTCQSPVYGSCTMTTASSSVGAFWIYGNNYYITGGIVVTSPTASCFYIKPNTGAPVTNVHVVGNYCNTAQKGGIETAPFISGATVAGADYVEIAGNDLNNAATGTTAVCNSHIDAFALKDSDYAPGVHVWIHENHAHGTVSPQPQPCDDTVFSTDRNCITFDRNDGSTSSGSNSTPIEYHGLILVENNLFGGCGGPAVEPFHNKASPIIVRNNTAIENLQDSNYGNGVPASSRQNIVSYFQAYNNIFKESRSTCCYLSGTLYTYADSVNGVPPVSNPVPDVDDYNWIDNTAVPSHSCYTSAGYACGPHDTLGTDPQFPTYVDPGDTSYCAGYTSPLACWQGTGVIAMFTPGNVSVRCTGAHIWAPATDVAGNVRSLSNCVDPGAVQQS